MKALKTLWLPWFFLQATLYPLALSGQEEKDKTASQKTKAAVEKFQKAPEAVGKALEGLNLGLGAQPKEKPTAKTGDRLAIPDLSTLKTPEGPRYAPTGKRDPFQPFTLKGPATASENLSPLERYDVGQFKLVAIIWDIREPRAMVEDSASLGYILKVGTPIGTNSGKVKAITPTEVVVEENYVDFYGARKTREVSMQLARD
jgi:type IV pilus assembly protein PilP